MQYKILGQSWKAVGVPCSFHIPIYPTLPFPTPLYPTLSYSTLSQSTLPYPSLPLPTLPYLTQPTLHVGIYQLKLVHVPYCTLPCPKLPDHVYLRYLSTEYRLTLSVDMSTNYRLIYRPILSRYVNRVLVAMLFKLVDCQSPLLVDTWSLCRSTLG